MVHPSLALTTKVVAGGALLASLAHAEDQQGREDSEPAPTFAYDEPVDKNYLRAIVELEAVFAVGLIYYVTTADRNWNLQYRWETYEHKFRWDTFGPDHNHFGTNFIGHPLGGAGYYLAARSNRLGVFESAAFSFAGSLLWEYFGEITERVSFNDTVVTPAAGIAIGEATMQLGAFFDRSGPETRHRVLGSVFGPFKSVNDWADDLKPKRAPYGFPKGEWHRFNLEAGGVVLQEWSNIRSAGPRGGVRLRASGRLARLPNFGGAGQHSAWFEDGNVSGMDLDGTLTEDGLSDLSFSARVLLAGYYFRDAQRVWGGELRGSGGVIGPSTAFEYSLHHYQRNTGGSFDKIAFVAPLGLSMMHRAQLGEAALDTQVHVGPVLGGVTAHAAPRYQQELMVLPEVMRLHNYYFGVGGDVRSEAELSWRLVELGASLRGDGYEVIQDKPPTGNVPIRDVRARVSSHFGYRIPRSSTVVRAHARHTLRRGAMGSARAETEELMWGFSLGGLF